MNGYGSGKRFWKRGMEMKENGKERCGMVVVVVNHALHLRSLTLELEHSPTVPFEVENDTTILVLA
jgi:hypothetical protein